MAKNIKIPLVMKNGEKATDMKSLVANFDVESVIGYFLDGKLEKWLNDRYYEDEAEAIAQFDKDDTELAKKLCDIFGVEYIETDVIDTEEIARRNERISRLKQLTDDEEVIKNIDFVAFNQEELAELYDKDVHKIYLCEGEFKIPADKRNLEYISICGAKADKLPKEQKQTTKFNDNRLSNVVISEDIEGEKCFCNARVKFERPITCYGSLKFENCEIVCNPKANMKYSKDFLKKCVIKLNNGYLEFKNCRIKGNVQENDFSSLLNGNIEYFIGGKNSKVYFDNCKLWSCKHLAGGKDNIGEVTFNSCVGQDVNAPIVDGNLKRISIINCDFKGREQNKKALIKLGEISRDCIEIMDSTFERFEEAISYTTTLDDGCITVGARKRGPLDMISDFINTPK